MRRKGVYGSALVLSMVLLASPVSAPWLLSAGLPSAQSSAPADRYPTTSWALGLVAPEGAKLAGGGALQWERVSNFTVLAVLPNITFPDGIVYAVASVMTEGGAVLQAAAGVYPNSSSWLSYSWSVPDINLVPMTYTWILNGSRPAMAAGESVAISIFRGTGDWTMRVLDVSTGSSVEREFPVAVDQRLKAGDQEVFALESYSRTPSTFQEMGNLTLLGIYADRQEVTGGLYSYSDWNTLHNPVFAVGSAGTSAPGFISIGRESDGSVVWSYDAGWQDRGTTFPNIVPALAVFAVASVSVASVAVWLMGWRGRGVPARGEHRPSGDCSTASVEYSLSVTPSESGMYEYRLSPVRGPPLPGPPGLRSGDTL